jgi:hypothetical protein
VTPSARERFTPCELTAAYKVFKERGPQYPSAETGLSASAYRFGERVLVVYEESETGLVVLIHWGGSRYTGSAVNRLRLRQGPR